MKIIFMGTPQIAVPALSTLIASEHELAAVVTKADKVSGRGLNVSFSPVKELAIKNNIEVIQPERISDEAVMDRLEAIGADVMAVAAFAQKIPDRVLEMSRFGCINLHPSLLPKYRGSDPLRAPILNGDKVSGVTIMKLVREWDAGDILMQKEIVLDKKETAASLELKAAELGAEMMLETIEGLEKGIIRPVPQDHEKASYYKQITKEAGIMDFSNSAEYIERQIRAMNPWPSAMTTLDGRCFKIWDADVLDKDEFNSEDYMPGQIVYADKHRFIIKTADGLLQPNEVQLEGKRRMSSEEFLRGKKLEAGVCFG